MSPRLKQLEELQETIRAVAARSGRIIVIGWKASNNDSNTRALEQAGLVEFRSDAPAKIDSRSHVLFTRFVKHATALSVRKRTGNYTSYFLQMGEIREVLGSLLSLLPSSKPKQPAKEEVATMNPHRENVTHSGAENVTVLPNRREIDKRVAFALAFSKAVNGNPEGSLSKYSTAQLLREHFGGKAVVNGYRDLLEPIVREGAKKTGSYKATSELLELATSTETATEPTEPIERARWLISKEKDLIARLSDLRSEIAATEGELQRISEAKNLLAQLERVLGLR